MDDIPKLLNIMTEKRGQQSAGAVKHIYVLCDVGHKQNRVPMVCSGRYNVLDPLAECLNDPHNNDTRRLACLALNNLSIPKECKTVMALGPSSTAIIGGLCKAIASCWDEAYLCCICLMNLSFLEDGITRMLQYSPAPEGYSLPIHPLDNPKSLVRIIEGVFNDTLAVVPKVPNNGNSYSSIFGNMFKRTVTKPKPTSVTKKGELLRWACGLVKNLAKSEENAAVLTKTRIPERVVDNIKTSATPPSQWTTNSLEDFSLFIVLNLAQWQVARPSLIEAGSIDVLKRITVEEGIQGLKASLSCSLLGVQPSGFPQDGLAMAIKSISELIANIGEEKGKEGQYAHGVFKMNMAREAYDNLIDSADDREELAIAVPLLNFVH